MGRQTGSGYSDQPVDLPLNHLRACHAAHAAHTPRNPPSLLTRNPSNVGVAGACCRSMLRWACPPRGRADVFTVCSRPPVLPFAQRPKSLQTLTYVRVA